MLPLICIPMGDPAGIGPEIIVRAIASHDFSNTCRLLIVGQLHVLSKALEVCQLALPVLNINQNNISIPSEKALYILPTDTQEDCDYEWGIVSANAGHAAFDAIKLSTKLALAGKVNALATTPINKKSLKAANIPHIGHTEILADLTDTPSPLTLFQVKNLRVFFLSRHLSLKQACEFVTCQNVYDCSLQAIQSLESLGVKNPKLAIAGLNPHSGEQGLFGSEEVEQIAPAVEQLRKQGLNVFGPIPADCVFHQALAGTYDAVLSLYHDQGHIATKMVDFERTVSITCGLPFLRTSVDHGTAFDIAGTGKASAVSMIEAIKVASQYSHFL